LKTQKQKGQIKVKARRGEALNESVSKPRRIGYFAVSGSKLVVRIAIVVLLILETASYAVATGIRMVQQGENLPTAAAEVARDSGFSPVVATLENIYYQYINPPKVGGTPTGAAAFDGGKAMASDRVSVLAPSSNFEAWGPATAVNKKPPRLTSPLPYQAGEGFWYPTKIKVNGATAVYVARVRPDKIHSSVYSAIAWFDPHLLAFMQVPGTQLPEGNFDHGNGRVPANLRTFYMAAFADGYKMDQSQGGYVNKGIVVKKLVDGKATLLTYPNGNIDVVKWNSAMPAVGFTTARQNLDMMVENGKSTVVNEDQAKWGQVWYGTGSGHNYVWRSGIGIRSDGTVVYVQSAALSAGTLADLLVRAGAVRAMALDMNEAFANGDLYGPYRPSNLAINPENKNATNKFWKRSTRDFVAVFSKSPANGAK
jgi:hypothetical protein